MYGVPILLVGCMVDSDHPCDANEVKLNADYGGCECAPGSVLNAAKDGCTACGANEEVKQGACACKAGFARPSEGAACAASMQGAACSATAACGGEFPYCSPKSYCTKSGCSSDADCSVGGYYCDTTASPAYCARPPTGQGKTCSSSADCAGLEANACTGGACLVSGCKTTATCHGGWACCDFSAFGMQDVCIPPTQLSGGKCPGTMADPVTR
jgi:hypothetical protein